MTTSEFRQKWIELLRSSKIKQAIGKYLDIDIVDRVNFDNSYPLEAACVVGVGYICTINTTKLSFTEDIMCMHKREKVANYAGFSTTTIALFELLNDRYEWSFDLLAKLIEALDAGIIYEEELADTFKNGYESVKDLIDKITSLDTSLVEVT